MNFALVQRPIFHPGVELLQLESPRGYVDTGVDMPIGGRVYLAENTVHEAARLFGMVTAKEADELRAQLKTADDTIASLARHLKERDPVFKALRAVMSDDRAQGNDVMGTPMSDHRMSVL